MPKKKKSAHDLTTQELAERIFPKQVVEELMRVAHESPKSGTKEKDDAPSRTD